MKRALCVLCALVLMTGLFAGSAVAAECPWDVVGITDFTPPFTANNFTPDGQVTFDYYNVTWWEDDTMACYYAYQNAAYLFYFPRCDASGDGAVSVNELLEIYSYALQTPIAGTSAFATTCPTDPEYTCDDLAGVDFGSCPAPLGGAILGGTCAMVFGCGAPAGIQLFASVSECNMFCTPCEENSVCQSGEYYRCPISGQCGLEFPMEPHGCELIPEACDAVYNPVCGCDAVTYGNECEAAMHSASVYHMGPCV